MRAESTTETSWQAKWLGTIDYLRAWELQAATVAERRAGRGVDTLYLLEHPPTYTVGRRGGREHLLVDDETLARLEAVVYEVDRGGDITYHGPGQLVGYPIVDLRRRGLDAHAYVRALEETLIRALAAYGLAGERSPGYPGVWLGDEKVAAIGVRIGGGVSSHGFALNVNTDLKYFRHIVPCGIHDRGVTSMARALGRTVPMAEVREVAARCFADLFGFPPLEVVAEPPGG